ncbi:MAG: hypothetical protein JSC189_000705 [Candidatus Tokpelaia sp. JSC189]|nr:MAG: hypothetical protein JSC189_000705 [Candidatus Tokpelaia sp. JSC189]
MRKTCVLVGNGTLDRDLSQQIDAVNYVFRFNKTPEFGGRAGTRTDTLMMVTTNIGSYNRKDKYYKFFCNAEFEKTPPIKAAKEIIFPVNPQIIKRYYRRPIQGPSLISRLLGHQKLDWTDSLIKLLGPEKNITILSSELYLQAACELGIIDDKLYSLFPSTGFICINHCLRQFDQKEWQIKLCGFTWQGWEAHLWDIEKQWVLQKQREGVLSFL